ncbi:hypothetical protein P775_15155 [Puniceibacterium antarcticum]|uniref:Fumarylacetoacetase-like C-terminal domain-containing protein n=1 Tax=Puniceibacterium antarcticum TaxID=1206336 RepID=A0A2G8RD22_9RHOB|nr:fumarylacetoacetate hydrolase family protein [Puniceibacterium antarcticum]PIL19475.1 hypothetical protein P775_15155 [Puniceibacterium antarcticum]
MAFVFPPLPQPALPVTGSNDLYPVGRIFCVGRNYAAHAAEMGNEVDREAPFYFTKSCHHLVQSGASCAYPPGTADYHHEIELVVALSGDLFRAEAADTWAAVYGYGVGLDMTRRDLQAEAKAGRRPWDISKDIEGGAVIGALTQRAGFGEMGDQRIALSVNDALRQEAVLSDMVWAVDALLAHLSGLYHLRAGDLVMMGTPAGVGAVVAGDRLEGVVDGLDGVSLTLGDAE